MADERKESHRVESTIAYFTVQCAFESVENAMALASVEGARLSPGLVGMLMCSAKTPLEKLLIRKLFPLSECVTDVDVLLEHFRVPWIVSKSKEHSGVQALRSLLSWNKATKTWAKSTDTLLMTQYLAIKGTSIEHPERMCAVFDCGGEHSPIKTFRDAKVCFDLLIPKPSLRTSTTRLQGRLVLRFYEKSTRTIATYQQLQGTAIPTFPFRWANYEMVDFHPEDWWGVTGSILGTNLGHANDVCVLPNLFLKDGMFAHME